MKVSLAAQILSHNVASVMHWMAGCNLYNSPEKIPKEAESTAEFILMEKVFDSVNGGSINVMEKN